MGGGGGGMGGAEHKLASGAGVGRVEHKLVSGMTEGVDWLQNFECFCQSFSCRFVVVLF